MIEQMRNSVTRILERVDRSRTDLVPSEIDSLTLIGFIGVLWICLNLFLMATGFVFSIPVTIWPLGLSLLLACAASQFLFAVTITRLSVLALGLIAAFGACLWVGAQFLDITADTRWYHSPATQLLVDGWNPVHSPSTPVPVPAESFPKGQWLLSAQAQMLTDSVRVGKGTGVFFILLTFLICGGAIREVFVALTGEPKTLISYGLALLLALHPISIGQLPIHYVDGQVANILTMVSINGLAFQISLKRVWFATFLMSVALAFAFKFNAAMFSIIIGLVALWPLIRHPAKFSHHWIALAVAGGLIIIANINPYITNVINHGSPLHPVVSFSQADDWELKRDYLEGINNVEAFLIGHTSGTHQLAPNEESLKSAWVAPWSEEAFSGFSYASPMARTIGLYGPFFPLILIVSAIGAIYLAISGRLSFAFAYGLIVLSLIVQSEGWHIRYSPQGWMLPVIVMLGLLTAMRSRFAKLFASICAAGVSVALFSSSQIALTGAPDSRAVTIKFEDRLKALSNISGCVHDADLKMPENGALSAEQAVAHGYTVCENSVPQTMSFESFVKFFDEDATIMMGQTQHLYRLVSVLEHLNSGNEMMQWRTQPNRDVTANTRSILVSPDGPSGSAFAGTEKNVACLQVGNDLSGRGDLYMRSAAPRTGRVSEFRYGDTIPVIGNHSTVLIAIAQGRLFVLDLPPRWTSTQPRILHTYEIERFDGTYQALRRAIRDEALAPCRRN